MEDKKKLTEETLNDLFSGSMLLSSNDKTKDFKNIQNVSSDVPPIESGQNVNSNTNFNIDVDINKNLVKKEVNRIVNNLLNESPEITANEVKKNYTVNSNTDLNSTSSPFTQNLNSNNTSNVNFSSINLSSNFIPNETNSAKITSFTSTVQNTNLNSTSNNTSKNNSNISQNNSQQQTTSNTTNPDQFYITNAPGNLSNDEARSRLTDDSNPNYLKFDTEDQVNEAVRQEAANRLMEQTKHLNLSDRQRQIMQEKPHLFDPYMYYDNPGAPNWVDRGNGFREDITPPDESPKLPTPEEIQKTIESGDKEALQNMLLKHYGEFGTSDNNLIWRQYGDFNAGDVVSAKTSYDNNQTTDSTNPSNNKSSYGIENLSESQSAYITRTEDVAALQEFYGLSGFFPGTTPKENETIPPYLLSTRSAGLSFKAQKDIEDGARTPSVESNFVELPAANITTLDALPTYLNANVPDDSNSDVIGDANTNVTFNPVYIKAPDGSTILIPRDGDRTRLPKEEKKKDTTPTTTQTDQTLPATQSIASLPSNPEIPFTIEGLESNYNVQQLSANNNSTQSSNLNSQNTDYNLFVDNYFNTNSNNLASNTTQTNQQVQQPISLSSDFISSSSGSNPIGPVFGTPASLIAGLAYGSISQPNTSVNISNNNNTDISNNSVFTSDPKTVSFDTNPSKTNSFTFFEDTRNVKQGNESDSTFIFNDEKYNLVTPDKTTFANVLATNLVNSQNNFVTTQTTDEPQNKQNYEDRIRTMGQNIILNTVPGASIDKSGMLETPMITKFNYDQRLAIQSQQLDIIESMFTPDAEGNIPGGATQEEQTKIISDMKTYFGFNEKKIEEIKTFKENAIKESLETGRKLLDQENPDYNPLKAQAILQVATSAGDETAKMLTQTAQIQSAQADKEYEKLILENRSEFAQFRQGMEEIKQQYYDQKIDIIERNRLEKELYDRTNPLLPGEVDVYKEGFEDIGSKIGGIGGIGLESPGKRKFDAITEEFNANRDQLAKRGSVEALMDSLYNYGANQNDSPIGNAYNQDDYGNYTNAYSDDVKQQQFYDNMRKFNEMYKLAKESGSVDEKYFQEYFGEKDSVTGEFTGKYRLGNSLVDSIDEVSKRIDEELDFAQREIDSTGQLPDVSLNFGLIDETLADTVRREKEYLEIHGEPMFNEQQLNVLESDPSKITESSSTQVVESGTTSNVTGDTTNNTINTNSTTTNISNIGNTTTNATGNTTNNVTGSTTIDSTNTNSTTTNSTSVSQNSTNNNVDSNQSTTNITNENIDEYADTYTSDNIKYLTTDELFESFLNKNSFIGLNSSNENVFVAEEDQNFNNINIFNNTSNEPSIAFGSSDQNLQNISNNPNTTTFGSMATNLNVSSSNNLTFNQTDNNYNSTATNISETRKSYTPVRTNIVYTSTGNNFTTSTTSQSTISESQQAIFDINEHLSEITNLDYKQKISNISKSSNTDNFTTSIKNLIIEVINEEKQKEQYEQGQESIQPGAEQASEFDFDEGIQELKDYEPADTTNIDENKMSVDSSLFEILNNANNPPIWRVVAG